MSDQQPATRDDEVRVHYTGTLDNGAVFDSSIGGEPLSFVIGAQQVIPGFDAAVEGMAVGESTTVRIEPADAYGDRQDDLIVGVPLAQAPEGLNAGDRVQAGDRPAVVLEVNDEHVVIDANHPLAGQALTFELELVGIG